MNALLADLGKQLVTKWTAALMVPGALFAGAVLLAGVLGQRHAVDPRMLGEWSNRIATGRTHESGTALLVAVAGFLLGAAAAGLLAGAVGFFVEWTWGLTGSVAPLSWLARSRRRRWARADAEAVSAQRALLADIDDSTLRARARQAILDRDAICLVPAERPTWVGDRLRAADVRMHRGYAIDLTTVWPRMWLVLPQPARDELTAVQERCASAARMGGWGVLYVLLGVFWWPGLAIGVAVLLIARYRARLAVGVYTDLIESTVDLYGRELATQLGLACPGRLSPEVGAQISAIVRKDEVARLPPAGPPPVGA
ncbi:hypothetical protein GCM10023322_28920 [Rugosimonospora acidiphila]|uniref:Vegetative cell wall protein gp1 n=1 Tax=Rugosimonospora acidiphila TaxID=556531 RepID=A0ABP9RRT5_9ACTN